MYFVICVNSLCNAWIAIPIIAWNRATVITKLKAIYAHPCYN